MDFREKVAAKIEEIKSRNKRPIIVGGSRLYILALTRGIFEGPDRDEELREKLRKIPGEELHDRLKEVDPDSAEKIHPHDTKRVVRALEVYKLTGRPISELKREADPLPYNFNVIGLTRPRKQLYERVNHRVEEMMEKGLLEEVEGLVRDGFCPDWGAWNTIGYKELAAYLNDEINYPQAVKRVKTNTRHLAKYQQNWMSKIEDLSTLEMEGEEKSSLQKVLRQKITQIE